MICRQLLLCKEGISVEELQNNTPGKILPSYVIRKDGQGVSELFERDMALEVGFALIKERVEGRTLEVYNGKRG